MDGTIGFRTIGSELFFNVIDHLHDCLCIAEAVRNDQNEITDFRCLYINEVCASNIASPREVITGKLFSEISACFNIQIFNLLKKAILKQEFFSADWDLLRPEAETAKLNRICRIKGTPHGDLLSLTWEYITEKNLPSDKLASYVIEAEESKEILNAILEYIPQGLTIADAPDVKIKAVSRWGQLLTSNAPEEYNAGWDIYDIDGKRLERFELPLESAILRGEITHNKELILKLPDGREIYISTDAGPIFNSEGIITGGLVSWRDITKKKKTEFALQESEKKFRMLSAELQMDREKLERIIENMPIGVAIVDISGKVIIANEYTRRIHGVSSQGEFPAEYEEYMKFFEFRDLEGQIITPDNWPVSRSFRGEYVHNFEATITNKIRNAQYTISYSVVPLFDSYGNIYQMIHVMEDITERKRQEKELKENREILQTIIDSVPAMMVIYDPEYRITHINKAFVRITGWSEEDTENTSLMELCFPDANYRNIVNEYIVSVHRGFEDFQMFTKSGEVIITSWANVELPDGKIASIGIDISERKSMEQKLVEAMKMLERSNRDLEQFAYAASHDLQSPLNQIKGFAQLLERKYKNKLDADADEYLGFIISAISRMTELIHGLLEFSRITTKAKKSHVVVRKVVSSALANLDFYIKDNNASVRVLDVHNVKGDAVLLTQLFQNLIQNGIKFHGTEPPEIIISSEKKDSEIIFTVSDNGIGIAPEHFQRVFLIFQRLHEEISYPGTGIGLAICKKIVEYHHGRIWVESEVNKGTRFHFSLPAG